MPLYEKFGLDPQLFTKDNFEHDQKMLLTYLNKEPPCIDLVSDYKEGLVSDSCRICFYYYLIDKKIRIKHYARPMFDYAIDYFLGEWLKTTPCDGKKGIDIWKSCLLWVSELRYSILWAGVLGEWDKAREISKYPDELCMEADFESKEKKAWYILLAIYLCEDSLKNAEKFIDIIENGKKKLEKLLLNVLRAIIAKDEKAFANEFEIYMKYYKAHEFSKPSVPEKLAIDGTILFNLAKHKGMKVEFPRKYIDHYVYLD